MSAPQEYMLQPKAPLVFRSGKPFQPGVRDEAQYPSPAAWAGLMRTQYMEQRGWRDLDHAQQRALLALPAHGVLLARRTAGGLTVFVPKPADAVCLQNHAQFLRLLPAVMDKGSGSDLPAGLSPVGMEKSVFDKPRSCPAYWSLEDYVAWAQGETLKPDPNVGLPLADARTHVEIDPARFTAADGQLFRTEALDFGVQRKTMADAADNPQSQPPDDGDWVLLGRGPAGLPAGLVVFGGERRLSYLTPNAGASLTLPQAFEQSVANAGGLAVTLASPALFRDGWKPGWLDDRLEGELPSQPDLRVKLVAAKIDRWHAVSGWDLHLRKPKPTRRAVAAGATYWFRILSGRPDPAALWLSPISDSAQDRNDGFGLALVRPWLFSE